MKNARAPKLIDGRCQALRLGDTSGDQLYPRQLLLVHDQKQAMRIGTAIEDHHAGVRFDKPSYNPGADETVRAGDQEGLVVHRIFLQFGCTRSATPFRISALADDLTN